MGALLRAVPLQAVAASLVLVAGVTSGCNPAPITVPSDARTVDAAAFVAPPKARPEVAQTPQIDIEPPAEITAQETMVLPDGTKVTRTEKAEEAISPATQKPQTKVTQRTERDSVRVGQRWPIESLVGQINGRPIYADAFFAELEGRILAQASNPDQNAAKRAVRALVESRFDQLVNNELIIAEAQSRVTPEMQQGVLAWLRNMQETSIAQRGGSRSQAEQLLREETGMSMEEFLESQKERGLIGDLLQRRVKPRVIVSWRDMEREYDLHRAELAPDPVYNLGRIALFKDRQAAEIEQVKSMLAAGKTFQEIVAALKVANQGNWMQVKLVNGQMQISTLADEVAAAVRPLKPGQVSPPVESRTQVTWYTVISEEVPQARTLFDPQVQLLIRGQLTNRRDMEARAEYIESLRSRWMSDDIQKMQLRLIQLAMARYFDPARTR